LVLRSREAASVINQGFGGRNQWLDSIGDFALYESVLSLAASPSGSLFLSLKTFLLRVPALARGRAAPRHVALLSRFVCSTMDRVSDSKKTTPAPINDANRCKFSDK
jgi:hypothetical protein